MKKLLLLFSLTVALSFSTKAQTSVYHPFPDSDAVWNMSFYTTQGITCYDDVRYSIIFGNDIQLGGHIYHTLVIPNMINISTSPCGGGPDIVSQLAIRQDTTTKKVYFIQQGWSNEELLYDFNLNIGDTLQPDSICFPGPFIVSTIDSVLIGNNYRKAWHDAAFGVLIEGIGTNHGLLSPPCQQFEASYTLLCFNQNGINLYPDSTTNCSTTSVNNLSEKNISITLSPNPFHTRATLTISDNSGIASFLAMTIYDVMGRVVQQQIINPKNSGSTIINREGLGDGLYFYQLRTNDSELIATGKFVVN